MAAKKIQVQPMLADIVKKGKASGKVVGFTNGCFDILHLGHIRYLNETKKECDILVVGVNSDTSVKSIKGSGRPVNDQESRMGVLAALESIDYLTLFDEDTPEKLIEKLTPDIIFKGGDWDEKDIVGAGHVKAHGGKVRVIPYVEGYSTTDLIKRLRKDVASGEEGRATDG
jgi:rfaE bifunctional protein nucleotidyltransferase chain/domain